MFKPLLAIGSALFLVVGVSAQIASELANKYAHHEVYEIQPGAQMKAKFAANALVCEMQMEQAHFGKDGVDLRHGIEKERISDLLDLVVPPSERGEKDDKPPSGRAIGTGQVMESIDRYATLRFTSSLLQTVRPKAGGNGCSWRWQGTLPSASSTQLSGMLSTASFTNCGL
jgi:hypothetical protein